LPGAGPARRSFSVSGSAGRSIWHAALAKEALLEPVDTMTAFEQQLCDTVNTLGIGPMGLGGKHNCPCRQGKDRCLPHRLASRSGQCPVLGKPARNRGGEMVTKEVRAAAHTPRGRSPRLSGRRPCRALRCCLYGAGRGAPAHAKRRYPLRPQRRRDLPLRAGHQRQDHCRGRADNIGTDECPLGVPVRKGRAGADRERRYGPCKSGSSSTGKGVYFAFTGGVCGSCRSPT